jgi:bifunctional non-homologous end joining protein LigD
MSGHFPEPMMCLAVSDLPAGPEWQYELKFDGYRAIGAKTRGHVALLSRNRKDFSQRFEPITRALQALPTKQSLMARSSLSTRMGGHLLTFRKRSEPSNKLARVRIPPTSGEYKGWSS